MPGIRGHETVIRRLEAACDRNELSHAYIFEGPKGIGRHTAAMHLTTYALCKSERDRPCGVCAPCRKAAGGNQEHIYELGPDGSSIKDAQVEEMQSFLLKKPYDEQRTFIIIDGAGLMTARAQNRMLKTLEEPPGKVTFILLAENAKSLTATILSRCVLIPFKPLPRSKIMALLSEKGASEQEAETVAALSFGLPGKAVSLLAAECLDEKRKAAAAAVFGLLSGRAYYQYSTDLVQWAGSKEEAAELLSLMQGMFRDILLIQAGAAKALIANIDYFSQMMQAAAKADRKKVTALIQSIETARNDIAFQVNIQYAIKNMMLCE